MSSREQAAVRPDLRLTRLLGARVELPGGRRGRLDDLAVDLAASVPVATGLVVRSRRGRVLVPWSSVDAERGPLERLAATSSGDPLGPSSLHGQEILLRRDLLDTIVYDRADRRRGRVGEVWLGVGEHGVLHVSGVETGAGPVRRRLASIAAGSSERPARLLALADLHLASPRGHEVQLALSPVADMADDELAHLVTHLPIGHARDLLRRLPDLRVQLVRDRVHPRVRERLDHAKRPAGVPGRRRLRRTAGWRSYRPDRDHRP